HRYDVRYAAFGQRQTGDQYQIEYICPGRWSYRMNLGAEPKKVMILGGLLAVAVVVYFINSSSTGDSGYKPSTARSGVGASAGRTPGIAAPLDLPSAPARQSRAAERE